MLAAIHVDTAADEFAMAAVRTRPLSRRRLVFVPLGRGVLGPGYVEVSYAKRQVRKALWIQGRRMATPFRCPVAASTMHRCRCPVSRGSYGS